MGKSLLHWTSFFLAVPTMLVCLQAESESIDFQSDLWKIENGSVVEFLDRRALTGTATLKDVVFRDGILEFDIAVTGARGFPGIEFRIQSPGNLEQFYVRPHKSGLPDALQYQPMINGSSTWQLYHGEGYTAVASLPRDKWIKITIEISGTQGRVFLDSAEEPALVIHDLQHGMSSGAVRLTSPPNRTAYFSNFRYKEEIDSGFEELRPVQTPVGTYTRWELSQAFPVSSVDQDRYPSAEFLETVEWKEIEADPEGIVNVSRFIKRSGMAPEVVLARTQLHSSVGEARGIRIGYSDMVSVFLNGKILFTGLSEFRRRDATFLGAMGLNDLLYLPLEAGENELLLMISESFGGWGFQVRDLDAVYKAQGMEKLWTTEKIFRVPESVVYDPVDEVLYVSNYDGYRPSSAQGLQSISKLGIDGEVISTEWVSGLRNPTGMALRNRDLFVVERGGVVVIDLESESIVERYPIKGSRFPNDIAIDGQGRLYVSDSGANVVHRIVEGESEIWLPAGRIKQPNGLWVHDGRLLLGTSSDHSIKSVDLETKEVSTLARFRSGIMDGLKVDGHGNILFSHWQGRVYRLGGSGSPQLVLDTTASETKCADFEYVPEKGLLIVPTFEDGAVTAYRMP